MPLREIVARPTVLGAQPSALANQIAIEVATDFGYSSTTHTRVNNPRRHRHRTVAVVDPFAEASYSEMSSIIICQPLHVLAMVSG